MTAVTDHTTSIRAQYAEAVLSGNSAQAESIVDCARRDRSMQIEEIYLRVLQPTLIEIGRRWERGEISVAHEHLATAATLAVAARLSFEFERSPDRGQSVVVTCTDGEFHSVGGRFVADFLAADGYRVLYLGDTPPRGDLLGLVDREDPDVIALSTTLPTNLPAVEDLIVELRRVAPDSIVAVGGQAYDGREELASKLGADLFAKDAATFIAELDGGGSG